MSETPTITQSLVFMALWTGIVALGLWALLIDII